jgi:RimJ/RimL family protein N-acetyltransferase
MRHTIQAEGFGVRLRPVRMDDAPFIVWIRNLEHVKGKIGDSAADIASQQQWLETYFTREGDLYFIVETMRGIPVGTHSLYNIAKGSAELGRWIIRPGVQAAVPSHMVAFSIAFDQLGLKVLRNVTVSSNTPVQSISRRFGFEQVNVEKAGRVIGGKSVDMVHFILTIEKWAQTRPHLVPMAQVAGDLVKQWDLVQKDSPFAVALPRSQNARSGVSPQ